MYNDNAATYNIDSGAGGGQHRNVDYYGNRLSTNDSGMSSRLCYQVDFNAIATGKVIAMSKRRIRWRFGFPNQEALDSGKSGIDCRGEEHDVTLVWSITSGKRMIMSNGYQIHVSLTKSRIFEHSWFDKNGTSLRLVVHSTQPTSNVSGVRQYDLFINGKSIFLLPKVYEIGLKGSAQDRRTPGVLSDEDRGRLEQESPSRRSQSYSGSGRNLVAPSSESQEQNELRKAIEASLQESRQHLAARGKLDEEESLAASTLTNTIMDLHPHVKTIQEEKPLIDFFSDPTPVSNSQALVPLGAPNTQYQLDDPFAFNPAPVYNAAPAPSVASAPMPPIYPVDEFAPQAPTYNDISSQILMDARSVRPSPSIESSNPFGNIVSVPPPSFSGSVGSVQQPHYAYHQQQSNNAHGDQPQMPNNGYQQPTQHQSHQAHAPSYGNYQM